MSRKIVNQSSECFATAEYFDDKKLPFIPAAVRYKVDDLTNARNVVPYTDIAGPSTFSRIAVTSSQNGMLDGHERETRRVTFEVTAPGGGVQYPNAEYDLIRTHPSPGDPP